MTTSCWHGSAATFVGPAYTVAWQCVGSFLCKASKPSPFSGSGLFYFGDILCHLNRPGHFEISSVFPNVSAPDSVIRNREHFWAWYPPENIFTFPSELNHHFQKKKVLDGLNLSFVQNLRSWKCLWEVDVNSEYFSQAPLEVFEESNFHYFCLCSLLINSTRRLESPTVQKIEPGSEEPMQSGHKLLFRQGLAMTHKKNIPCLWNTVSVNSLSIKSQMYKHDIKKLFFVCLVFLEWLWHTKWKQTFVVWKA